MPSKKTSSDNPEESSSLLKLLMTEVEHLDLTDPDDLAAGDPGELIQEGFAISKLFAIIEFGLRHARDEEGLLADIDMMDRTQAMKNINGVFLFEVTSPSLPASSSPVKAIFFLVDMRKSGTITKIVASSDTKPPRKPDVTIRVSDKDMVDLAMGKAVPQNMFLKGRLKVKGNLMLGLKMNNILQKEIAKLSKL